MWYGPFFEVGRREDNSSEREGPVWATTEGHFHLRVGHGLSHTGEFLRVPVAQDHQAVTMEGYFHPWAMRRWWHRRRRRNRRRCRHCCASSPWCVSWPVSGSGAHGNRQVPPTRSAGERHGRRHTGLFPAGGSRSGYLGGTSRNSSITRAGVGRGCLRLGILERRPHQ